MASTPEPLPQNRIEFRAPPPSPIASGRRSTVTNDDVLTEFLEHSHRVPDLILPDRVFPRQKSIPSPSKLDFQLLTTSPEHASVGSVLKSISEVGCFEVVNHGISRKFIRSVLKSGAGMFELSPEKKAMVSRSEARAYGFEEIHGEEEGEEEIEKREEEFVWFRDRSLKLEMEGIWPLGYQHFSQRMERVMSKIERVAERILHLLLEENMAGKPTTLLYDMHEDRAKEEEEEEEEEKEQLHHPTICYLYKHYCGGLHSHNNNNSATNALKYDVIRMLIRGSECSHALCFHLCNDSPDFHVYSKRGWVSFTPDKDAIVVTIGDQLQGRSNGRYKHVIGRPMFQGEEEEDDSISMAFLYSQPNTARRFNKFKGNKTVSLGQQALMAILLTLLYHFLIYIYNRFL